MEIADDGSGIPAAAKSKVFDLFYTVDYMGADSRRGLGLGLPLCKSIIDAHGGAMYVKDNVPRGTVFGFTLHVECVVLMSRVEK